MQRVICWQILQCWRDRHPAGARHRRQAAGADPRHRRRGARATRRARACEPQRGAGGVGSASAVVPATAGPTLEFPDSVFKSASAVAMTVETYVVIPATRFYPGSTGKSNRFSRRASLSQDLMVRRRASAVSNHERPRYRPQPLVRGARQGALRRTRLEGAMAEPRNVKKDWTSPLQKRGNVPPVRVTALPGGLAACRRGACRG